LEKKVESRHQWKVSFPVLRFIFFLFLFFWLSAIRAVIFWKSRKTFISTNA